VFGFDTTAADQDEVIFGIRIPASPDDDPTRDNDIIPTGAAYIDDILLDLRAVASQSFGTVTGSGWRGAIDWYQLGNEAFSKGAPGHLYFTPGQLQTVRSTFDGDFGDLQGENPIGSFTTEDVAFEAVGRYFVWLQQMATEVRAASAFHGRPGRILTPAFTMGNLFTPANADIYDDSDDLHVLVAAVFSQGNVFADACDVHFHWDGDADDGQLRSNVPDIIHFTEGTVRSGGDYNWLSTNGWVPEQIGCTEWGPKANGVWWGADDPDNPDYEYGDTVAHYVQNNANLHLDWNDFILERWLKDSDGPDRFDPNIPMTGGITQTAADLSSSTYLFACYGEALQGEPDYFTVSPLQASQVKPNHRGPYWGMYGWNKYIHDPVTAAMTSDAFVDLNCLHPELTYIVRVEP